jgi:SAM-dependent methyltransferase
MPSIEPSVTCRQAWGASCLQTYAVTDEHEPWSDREPWSHNAHYHRVILAAVPPSCERVLDVGCGQGALTRRLRSVVPEVTGMDRDERSIEIACAHQQADGISYVLGDFLAVPLADGPLRPGSFDLVTAVASMHHMDTEAALRRMAELLRPGGVLAVVGLARDSSPADIGLLIPAVICTRVRLAASAWARRGVRSESAYQSPIVWPPAMTYRQVRRLAAGVLPGAKFRRRLYWRYSLVWTKLS